MAKQDRLENKIPEPNAGNVEEGDYVVITERGRIVLAPIVSVGDEMVSIRIMDRRGYISYSDAIILKIDGSCCAGKHAYASRAEVMRLMENVRGKSNERFFKEKGVRGH